MLFVSYASQDRKLVEPLVAVLRSVDPDVWLDDQLNGGVDWWNTILDRIRDCTVFVVALSDNSLKSKPCQDELKYAQKLHRPVLPVKIGPAEHLRLSPLGMIHNIDYQRPDVATNAELVRVLNVLSRSVGPLPTPLPERPPMPFAYLERFTSALERADLSYAEQNAIVVDLRKHLSVDPTVKTDIIQLLCRLRDRPDIAVHIRDDVDRILVENDPGIDDETNRIPRIRRLIARPSAANVGNRESVGPHRKSPRWPTKLLVAGAVLAVAAAGALAFGFTRTRLEPITPVLIADENVQAVMETPAMVTVQADMESFKRSDSIEASRPECLGVLYPSLDQVYQGSQAQHAAWKVLEEPGGLERAGVRGRPFVDQGIAVFAPQSGRAAAFVQQSVAQWRACAGQAVTVSYPDHHTYSWNIADTVGDAPRITQTYTLGNDSYTCERVLKAVADAVIDIKACGAHITDEAGVLTDRIAALVARAPKF